MGISADYPAAAALYSFPLRTNRFCAFYPTCFEKFHKAYCREVYTERHRKKMGIFAIFAGCSAQNNENNFLKLKGQLLLSL